MATRKATPVADKPAAKAAAPKLKAPKTLAAAADRAYTVREERLAITREAEKRAEPLKVEEAFLREHLIENLPKSDATGVAGSLVRVTVKSGVAAQADDWDKIYGWIVDSVVAARKKKSDVPYAAFAILRRALAEEAVKEMWEAGKAIPGVGRFNTKSLSFNKL